MVAEVRLMLHFPRSIVKMKLYHVDVRCSCWPFVQTSVLELSKHGTRRHIGASIGPLEREDNVVQTSVLELSMQPCFAQELQEIRRSSTLCGGGRPSARRARSSRPRHAARSRLHHVARSRHSVMHPLRHPS
jgi:hypothetical protein